MAPDDLAVVDERVHPPADEPITRRNRPLGANNDARTVLVDVAVPSNLTVMTSPVHGFTSSKTSTKTSGNGRTRGRRNGERKRNDTQQTDNEPHHCLPRRSTLGRRYADSVSSVTSSAGLEATQDATAGSMRTQFFQVRQPHLLDRET